MTRRLAQANVLNAKGIVVHAGRQKKFSKEVALKKQVETLRNAIRYAGKCRILIETPCGELLTNESEEYNLERKRQGWRFM